MRTSFVVCCLLLSTSRAGADPGLELFEKKIRPVLVEHCYSCHSSEANKKRGGLHLDSRDALRKGGDTGRAIVPGDPAKSLLLAAVRQTGELKMPPKGKLPDAVLADLEEWVKLGAPDPRDTATTKVAASWPELLRNRRQWWSLQPVRKPAVPAVKDATWSAQPVDRFILAALEARSLTPAEPADRRTLIRRLSLVLIGLPPKPEDVEAFVHNTSPLAVERLIDRLLASPAFGERWARHWLDVVRFSETHGNEWNYEVHHAWRYRDYLIRALNDDVPYDQLVREHLAGDLLAQQRWNLRDGFNESIHGTAFFRFGEVNHDDCIGLRQIGYNLVDNQIDTLSKAFQATTIACARCHDHKLDAVSMQDYYALLGILRSSRQVSHTIDAPEVNTAVMQRLRALKVEVRKELGEVWLRESRDSGRYLLAARARHTNAFDAGERARGLDLTRLDAWVAALQAKKTTLEDPLEPWRRLVAANPTDAERCATEWRKLAELYTKEDRERTAAEKKFVSFADFTSGLTGWQAGGHSLRDGVTQRGEFALHPEGEMLVRAILPGGCFTHTLSDRLNGTLRSPLLPGGKTHISLQVVGQRSSAVRLVSNNCQLNYKNYRALTTPEPQWLTFPIPEDRESLRVYAELMTLLDNPKFPDQLSALGGDPENYRLPWDKAAANPRSYFGVTRVVLHDGPEPPKPELSHLRQLFPTDPPATLESIAARYTTMIESAIRAWSADRATDEDVRWLDSLLRRSLFGNRKDHTPRLTELTQRYRQTEAELTLPRIVPGLADFGPGCEQAVFTRGDCLKPGENIARRYLEVLSQPGERFAPSGSGRRELAERIASPTNPLTARVFVNRVWHHLFGTGLVRTVDDFGRVGELPSHPELLDYLATRFVEDGWSMKRLIRALVLTRTFQMANRVSPSAKLTDPQNRLLHHYPARRLEAEAIRDSLLNASGRLDRTLYGPSIPSYREKANADRRLFPGPLDGHGRRSVYIKNTLMEPPRFLSVFDFPGGKVAQGRRDVTNVPAQALALLNDPFVLQQAEVWAARLVARPDASVPARLELLFRVALGRPPQPDELQRFERTVAGFADLHAVPMSNVLTSAAVWKDVAHTMFNVREFLYIP